ncbi:unnamed protein product, partial [Brenthis ino]
MPLIDTTGFVTGWGRCDFTGNELCLPRASEFFPDEIIDPMLRTVSVNIASLNLYCEGYIRHGIKLHAGMLCAGAVREEYPSFACSAVPGAPLVVHGKLAGILSWGFGCGYAHDLPLVYTSMQYHTKWIAYNVMLLRKLSIDDLTPLFQATKSYIVMGWLSKTSISKTSPHRHVFYKNIRQMPFDLELVNLLGNTYDIRDFLNDGEVHSKKSELYEEIKKDLEQNNTHLLKKKQNLSLLKQTLKTYPFINQHFLLNANLSYDSASDNEYQII